MSALAGTIAELGGRAASRARQTAQRRRIDRITVSILASVDRDQFNRRFRENPALVELHGHGSSKYIDLEHWMRENVSRYVRWALHRPPGRVLDVGCGSGFFLVVCRHMGREALGVDMDFDPLYGEQTKFFGVDRVLHRVTPGDYLPPLDQRFALVTAFMTGFNHDPVTQRTWGSDEWLGYFEAARAVLQPHGRIFVRFNRYGGELYPGDLPAALRDHGNWRARFSGLTLDLRPAA
jgi:SAM-dependent methyltransferase